MKRTAGLMALAIIAMFLLGCADKTSSPENQARTKQRQQMIAARKNQDQ
jgi:hypothetical protein